MTFVSCRIDAMSWSRVIKGSSSDQDEREVYAPDSSRAASFTSMTARAPAPETLLVHTNWMRRLARSLVRDDAQADDVVQDAMAAALRSPPRDPLALPAWLAATVRNAARQMWRGESRRAAREASSARPESLPGAAEVVARAEEHGLVVQAVVALDEPYRTALLLRFFDDLPPREVAQRTGVPLETARARIRRGLDQLRGSLDRVHGGDGRTWRLALVPLMLDRIGAGSAAGTGAGATGSKITTGALTMASGVTAAVGGLALLAGIAVGWWTGSAKSDDSARELTREAETARVAQASAESDKESLRQSVAKLEALLRDAQTKTRDAEKQIASLREELAAKATVTAPAPAAATEPAAAKGPRFAFGQYAKLNDVDWKGVGEHLNAISSICGDIAGKMAKGEDFTAEQGKAAQHNGYLINAAVKIVGQVPGTGVNGAFTHPAFQANAIASALEAAGKPLTLEQGTAIEKVAREFSDEDAQRLLGYKETTYGLQKVIDEADVRRRFFDAAFAALTEEQRNALTPPETKGLLGLDLYSDGLLWITLMRPVQFKDAAGLADTITTQVQGGMKVPKEQTEPLRALVGRWVADLPASLIDPPAQQGGPRGRMHVDVVRLAAQKTLALAESIVTEMKLEGAAATTARRWSVTLVPVRDEE
jgi:RNA polymerase sigma-70 factor (ECF subfamily)